MKGSKMRSIMEALKQHEDEFKELIRGWIADSSQSVSDYFALIVERDYFAFDPMLKALNLEGKYKSDSIGVVLSRKVIPSMNGSEFFKIDPGYLRDVDAIRGYAIVLCCPEGVIRTYVAPDQSRMLLQ